MARKIVTSFENASALAECFPNDFSSITDEFMSHLISGDYVKVREKCEDIWCVVVKNWKNTRRLRIKPSSKFESMHDFGHTDVLTISYDNVYDVIRSPVSPKCAVLRCKKSVSSDEECDSA